MNWTARGVIEGEVGERGMWGDSLEFSPPRDEMDEALDAQVKFAMDMIGEGFARGVIDGAYSCSISGHVDKPGQEGDRKAFSLSLTPTP